MALFTLDQCHHPQQFSGHCIPNAAVRGSGGTERSSSSNAVEAEKASVSSSEASDTAAKAGAAESAGRETSMEARKKAKAAPSQVKRAARAGPGGKKDVSVDGGRSEPYVYAESLAYLSSPPKKALKGVGPVKAEQLAKLGKICFV